MGSALHDAGRKIFVPLIGQFDNIGDIVLRRPLARWLQDCGQLHVYTGPAPETFLRALKLPPSAVTYRSFATWYAAAFGSAIKGQAQYAFKPGEIQLSLKGLKEHLSVLPLIATVRLRGGHVVRVGSGARNQARWARALMGPSLCMSEMIRWRDPETAAFMRCGTVMPDLAFEDGDDASAWLPAEQRNLLVLSMRGDRVGFPEGCVAGVVKFAHRHGLRIQVVTQVARDDGMSSALAARLGGEVLSWDGADHVAQEARLRAVYRRTRVAVSDRLHVLVAAYTHGAVPFGLPVDGSGKIARHFAAAGIANVVHSGLDFSASAIEEELAAAWLRAPQLLRQIERVRSDLCRVRQELVTLLAEQKAAPLPPRGVSG